MNFEEFKETILENIAEYLTDDVDEMDIYIQEVYKNNDVKYHGLIMRKNKAGIAPTVYLEPYYRLLKNDFSIEDIMIKIRDEYYKALETVEKAEKEIRCFDDYKDKIFLKVVNYKKNEEKLQKCPYLPFFDLAITFRYMVLKDKKGLTSFLINNNLANAWGVSVKELYKIASENTKKLFPPVITGLGDVFGSEVDIKIGDDYSGFYLLSSDCGINGSTYIIYRDVLSEFAKKSGCDLYIIPSSVHEVILVQEKRDFDIDDLKTLIKDVNEMIVPGEDFLSDNMYRYSVSEGLSII